MLTREQLHADLEEHFFAPTAGAPRVGLEVELIPVDAATRRAVPLEGSERSALAIARAAGATRGWNERRSLKAGVSEFVLPCGGMLTFEPGAQLEYSAPPNANASRTLTLARDVIDALRHAAAARGIDLLAIGIDPHTPIADVAPQLPGERYRRMLAHFDRIGPAGAMMMRQTASVQIALDRGADPLGRWRLLNALAPIVVATFASSPSSAWSRDEHRSVRRHVWGTLDPCRTGLAANDDEPIARYLDFALGAHAFLLGDERRATMPFAAWMDRDEIQLADWRAHLSTLFPEVRPRDGYFELRSADAIEPEWHPALMAMVAGIAYDDASACRAAMRLDPPSAESLARAGRVGLGDGELATQAASIARLALDACASLGESFMSREDVERARAYFERYTFRARSPADDAA